MSSRGVGGRGCDVANHVGSAGGGTVHSWRLASSLQRSPVGRRGKAGMVGGVKGKMGGLGMRSMSKWRCGGRGKVGRRGRSFIRQLHKWGRSRLIWVQEGRWRGGVWEGRAERGGAFHGRGGA